MTAREDREKEKFTKETVVKYFFDMSKSTFTVMVLGGMAALFGIVQTNQEDSYWAIFWGVFLTVILFCVKVPVLSLHTIEALPNVSTAGKRRMIAL